MSPRPVSNPPNPWATTRIDTDVDWLDAEPPPEARLEVFEEEAGTVLAENDSPDVGFRWSVNPYRGCYHGCAYCLEGATPVLMGDGTSRPIADVRVGDEIYGTQARDWHRRYRKTRVLAHWTTQKDAYRIVLADGREIVASGDHRFLTERGWKHVAPAARGQRPFLTPSNRLLGPGTSPTPPRADNLDFRRGYLCGLVRGDGLFRTYRYVRNGRIDVQRRFRLALVDSEGLDAASRYLSGFGVPTTRFPFQPATATRRALHAIRAQTIDSMARIQGLIEWPDVATDDWSKGFLAGIFDAEGGLNQGVLRISNTDPVIVDRISRCLDRFRFDSVVETQARRPPIKPVHCVRLRGGLGEHLRFFQTCSPAIVRKTSIEGCAVKHPKRLGIAAIEPLGRRMEMYDITTGTGDFVANGAISHNCYARPSHQYLGFGAGTDFERKIVVKTNAPEALRAGFLRPSWKGEPIAFSGNTDCYQPLEAHYRLTRRCLETCLEFRNPVTLITKGALVRRDVDVLAALAREASASVSVSIPFADESVARKMEPYVGSPARRFETMRLLSDAGVPTRLALAPVIPGLNDADVPELLRRAKDAGARGAFFVMLRLAGEVKPVFRERLEEAFPDRAKKVWSQIRDVRGGAEYRGGFGERMRGEGPRWDVIRDLFHVHCARLGLNRDDDEGDRPSPFRRPSEPTLFDL